MNDSERFQTENAGDIAAMKGDPDLMAMSRMWARAVAPYRYPYHFRWMGQPIIQVPQDILAMQELIFQIRPRAIIETGIARGGSAIFYASMLALLGEGGFVVGVDVDIRQHNREAIEAHPMAKHIKLVQGSSIDASTVAEVHALVGDEGPVIVALDSNHTKEHVLEELRAYSCFVKKGSYLVVFDTLLEDLPSEMSAGRPWGPGNGPKSAVEAFLRENDRFVIDDAIAAKLPITVAPIGCMACVKVPS